MSCEFREQLFENKLEDVDRLGWLDGKAAAI